MKNLITFLLWIFLVLIALSCEQHEIIGMPGHVEKQQSLFSCYLSGRGIPPIKLDTCADYAHKVYNKGHSPTKTVINLDSAWLATGVQIEAAYQSGTQLITIGNAPQLLIGEWKVMKTSEVPIDAEYAWELDYYTAENQFLQLLIGSVGNGMSHLNYLDGNAIDYWTAIHSLDNGNFWTTINLSPPAVYNWGQVLWNGNPNVIFIRRNNIVNSLWHVILKVN
jgi:hypothetical protein